MPTNNPRVNVTFSEDDAEVLQLICKKKKINMSSLVRKVVLDWLEEYEDLAFAIRAEKIEQEWEKKGRPTISHEELWKRLDTR